MSDKQFAEAIRKTWASAPRSIGESYLLKFTFNGAEREIVCRQDAVQTPSNQLKGLDSVLHLTALRKGRLLADLPMTYIANHLTLNGRNETKFAGLPYQPSEEQINQYKALGCVFEPL